MASSNEAERQAYFVEHGLQLLHTFQNAQTLGWDSPVAFLFNQADETAADLTDRMAPEIEAWQNACREKELPLSGDDESVEDDGSVVFAMPFAEAQDRLQELNENAATFLERGREMQMKVDRLNKLALLLIISHGFIDCKLQPLQPTSLDAGA